MNKIILEEYIDACELMKETEAEICKLNQKKKMVPQTGIEGTSSEVPYMEQLFRSRGTMFTQKDNSHLQYEEKTLMEQKAKAQEVKRQVEDWMLTIPIRMQRIIRYRYLEGLTWEQVAVRMGRRATENSMKKEFERFLKNF